MSISSDRDIAPKKMMPFPFLLLVALAATRIGSANAFMATRGNRIDSQRLGVTRFKKANDIIYSQDATTRKRTRKSLQQHRQRQSFPLRSTNFGYEYIPPNPDASPGSFHMSWLRSSYPPGTPAGLRGEAVRSALVTTERCIGWNLSTNPETSVGGVLEISGKGTIDFLNGKLTRDFRTNNNSNGNNSGNLYKEACLLDAKGRLIDVLRVALDEDNRRAMILTSPGHSSADLLKRLDPYVFPMDEVSLTEYSIDDKGDNRSFVFTLASTQYKHVQKAMREQSKLPLNDEEIVFSGTSQGVIWKPRVDNDIQILVIPSTGVAPAACVGYTFVFFGSGPTAATMGRNLWEHLIGEENLEGPVEVGALEYETLRVQAGQPAYGHEFGIDLAAKQKKEKPVPTAAEEGPKKKQKKKPSDLIKTSPFELHFDRLIDLDKGCYLGQEGIASVLRNPRGSPRTLYTVVFEDDFNIYESQSRGDRSDFENLTTLPKPGQKLCALGSNEELKVGTLTSMGEAGGTGSPNTLGLALIKRADGILKKMEELDLEIPRDTDDFLNVDFSSGSGIIQPPPLDPLDGLEVVVEGTFTMGVLKSIPTRQSGLRKNTNMYDPEIEVEGIEDNEPFVASAVASTTVDRGVQTDSEGALDGMENDDDLLSDLEEMEAEVARATAEAEAAAAEAKRKAEKMEMLKKRAEEAIAKRKQNAAQKEGKGSKEAEATEDIAAAEAKRKAEKMAMLQKRADEAMARRKAKKEEQS